MNSLDILVWGMGGGFTVLFALLCFLWSAMSSRFDKVDERFERLEAKVEDIDRRLCRIEGGLASNSYCAISNYGNKKRHHS